MKKSIIPVAAFIAGMAIVPSVFAEDAKLELGDAQDNTYTNATFEASDLTANSNSWKDGKNTAGLAAAGAVTTVHPKGDKDYSVVELHYNTLNLTKTLECDHDTTPGECDADRPGGYSWLGLKVVQPKAGTNELGVATVSFNGGTPEQFKIESGKDVVKYIGINETTLTKLAQKGENPALIGTFEFDWDGKEGIDQTVRVYIDYKNVTLYDFELDEDGEPTGIKFNAPVFTPQMAASIVPGSTDEPATDEPTTDAGEEAENPNTADTIATYLTIATVALLGLGATAFVAKKSNR